MRMNDKSMLAAGTVSSQQPRKTLSGNDDEVAYEGSDPVKRYKDTVSRQGKIAARRN